MGYISFYRKWRPQNFDEIVGQKYNIQTLKNVLDNKKLSHSYIFCGPRGTGKTSTARILAKAINCMEGISSAPCNKCRNCKSISEGSNVDVIEIDAASNRGINEIRELREKVKYLPNDLRKKIYIIDEVHMLTTEAFNALLKVLEEPPEHVVFIMATTEPNKVIPTIMSRCQRFDFFPIPLDLIKKRLAEVAGEENISISDTALGLVAKYADGSLRDADGILEQLAAYSDEKIGSSEVVALLGVVDIEILFEFVNILTARDIKKGLKIVDRIIRGNQDLKSFTSELIDHLYDLYVVKNYEKPSELIDLSRDYLEKYKKQAKDLQNEELDYYIGHFTDLLKHIKWGESSRTFFKSSVIQALNYIILDDRQLEKKTKAWDARLDAIERKIENTSLKSAEEEKKENDLDIIKQGDVNEPIREDRPGIVSDKDAAREINESQDRKKTSGRNKKKDNNAEGDISIIEKNMDRILEVLKKRKISVYAMFMEAGPGHIEGSSLCFYLEENKKWHKDHLNKTSNSAIISSVINEVTGKKYKVKFETGEIKSKNGGSVIHEGPPVEEVPAGEPEYIIDQEAEKPDREEEIIRDDDAGDAGDKKTRKKDSAKDGSVKEDAMSYFEKKFDIKE